MLMMISLYRKIYFLVIFKYYYYLIVVQLHKILLIFIIYSLTNESFDYSLNDNISRINYILTKQSFNIIFIILRNIFFIATLLVFRNKNIFDVGHTFRK